MFRSKTQNLIFPQAEHSRLAGAIANLWGNDDFDRPNFNFKSFVTGVTLHDVGYGYFDSHGIGEMNSAARLAVTRQLVESRLDDAIAQTVMHFHVLRLLGNDVTGQPLRVACEQKIELGISKTGISRRDYLWADRITNLCDKISFEFCFDKPSQGSIAVYPKQESRDAVTVNFEIRAQGEIKVSPWPFGVYSYEGFTLAYEADGYPESLTPTLIGYRLSE